MEQLRYCQLARATTFDCPSAPCDLLLLSRTIMAASLVLAVPLYQSLVVILAAVAGNVFFSEGSRYSHAQWASFLGGIALVVCGMSGLGATNAERELKRREVDMVVQQMPVAGSPEWLARRRASHARTPSTTSLMAVAEEARALESLTAHSSFSTLVLESGTAHGKRPQIQQPPTSNSAQSHADGVDRRGGRRVDERL